MGTLYTTVSFAHSHRRRRIFVTRVIVDRVHSPYAEHVARSFWYPIRALLTLLTPVYQICIVSSVVGKTSGLAKHNILLIDNIDMT